MLLRAGLMFNVFRFGILIARAVSSYQHRKKKYKTRIERKSAEVHVQNCLAVAFFFLLLHHRNQFHN